MLKFAANTGVHAIAGRFTPGAFTNYITRSFKEPRLIVVTDPRVDHQAIREASYVNIPVIALCDTDAPLKYVDVAIPTNNKARHSIGLIWWLLCREVLRLKGTVPRTPDGWGVMVDMFFYRDPDEVDKELEDARLAKEAAAAEPAGADWDVSGGGATGALAVAQEGGMTNYLCTCSSRKSDIDIWRGFDRTGLGNGSGGCCRRGNGLGNRSRRSRVERWCGAVILGLSVFQYQFVHTVLVVVPMPIGSYLFTLSHCSACAISLSSARSWYLITTRTFVSGISISDLLVHSSSLLMRSEVTWKLQMSHAAFWQRREDDDWVPSLGSQCSSFYVLGRLSFKDKNIRIPLELSPNGKRARAD